MMYEVKKKAPGIARAALKSAALVCALWMSFVKTKWVSVADHYKPRLHLLVHLRCHSDFPIQLCFLVFAFTASRKALLTGYKRPPPDMKKEPVLLDSLSAALLRNLLFCLEYLTRQLQFFLWRKVLIELIYIVITHIITLRSLIYPGNSIKISGNQFLTKKE